jgi:long-chain acyl-CoA synthetase
VFRSTVSTEGSPPTKDVFTLYEMFTASADKFAAEKCLGTIVNGKYEWLTYKETADIVASVGSAMAHAGLEAHGRAGVYGANSAEWMMAMQACNRMNLYCVPLYDTLGENAIEYIINHSEASIVFAQASKLGEMAKALPNLTALVKTLVYWGAADAAVLDGVKALGIAVHSWDEFVALGKANPAEPRPPKPEDLCTIMYTSGTTGDPKVSRLLSTTQMRCSVHFKSPFLFQSKQTLNKD